MEILLVSFDYNPQGYMDAVGAFCKECHGRCSPCLLPIHHTKTELENGENLDKAKESIRLAEKTEKATPLARTMSDDEVAALAVRVGESRLPQHVTMRDGSVRLNPDTKVGSEMAKIPAKIFVRPTASFRSSLGGDKAPEESE
jgi:hypothetical protein